MTPRGVDVEPEVYCRRASDEALSRGMLQAFAASGVTASLARSSTGCGAFAIQERTRERMADEVRTTRGSASTAIGKNLVRLRVLRGGLTGTAVVPA
jgi:hypothetical protein